MAPATTNIMEYVGKLETKVRYYQSQERRFKLAWFIVGCVVGASGVSLLWLAHFFF